MKFNITAVDVTDQEASDILTTAVEGGISYWAGASEVLRASGSGTDGLSELSVYSVTLFDREDPEDPTYQATVDLDTIRVGLNRLLSGEVQVGEHIIGYITGEDIDADAADCIVQAGAFNSVVFG